MSKIGKKNIAIPEGVEVNINLPNITVKGPKGELSHTVHDGIIIKIEDGAVSVSIEDDLLNAYRGLHRSLIANIIQGVNEGYEKTLLIMGVGYGAELQGRKLVFSLGYSHKIDFELPEGVKIKIEQNPKGDTIITLNSIDKQLIGQTAAMIRGLRKPEPYKGKGIRYSDEQIKLKPGKTAAIK